MTIISSPIHDIEVGNLASSSLSKILDDHKEHGMIVIVDQNTHDLCLEYLITTFPQLKKAEIILLPVGEENKVMEVCMQVWNAFSEYGFGRKDLVLNLGGGVVTDMGGFLASVFKRGMNFIHIPTSLLGMVDASIGGKVGIDLNHLKNQIGVFNHPQSIFINQTFLETLPHRDFINGFAEVIKHALIYDIEYFKFLQSNDFTDPSILNYIISKSIHIKNDIVLKDELDLGVRKVLNFGHTIGHAIETTYLNKLNKFLHGEAIAIGMICEAYISNHINKLRNDELEKITNYIRKVFKLSKVKYYDEIIKNAYFDKKNLSEKIRTSSLKGIGNCEYDIEIKEDIIIKSLNYYNLKCDG